MTDPDPHASYLSPAGPRISPLKRVARKVSPRLRTRVHWWIYDTPVISEFASKRDAVMRIAHVSDQTVLVLDGFPRSGNSYARAAFMYANGTNLNLSTHGHSHRFPEMGARSGIPVIVLIRDPDAAIASLLRFEPTTDTRMLAKAYTRYYSGILDILDSVLVATFEEVTADFGDVIERCNRAFGSQFKRYEKTPEAEAAVHAHIDAGTRNAVTDERFDAVVPRPGFREPSSGQTAANDPQTARAMETARAIHREVLAKRGTR